MIQKYQALDRMRNQSSMQILCQSSHPGSLTWELDGESLIIDFGLVLSKEVKSFNFLVVSVNDQISNKGQSIQNVCHVWNLSQPYQHTKQPNKVTKKKLRFLNLIDLRFD